jgi:hypothetical protein
MDEGSVKEISPGFSLKEGEKNWARKGAGKEKEGPDASSAKQDSLVFIQPNL